LERDCAKRFWTHVEKTDNCWNWLAAKTRAGYGQYGVKGRLVYAHRYAYELATGHPPRKTLDHLCRNPRCVNPDHLEDVSMRENILRGTGMAAIHAVQTHCINGHEFNDTNARLRKIGKKGGKVNWRECRVCERERKKIARRKARP
jgi:HNH endonuclease